MTIHIRLAAAALTLVLSASGGVAADPVGAGPPAAFDSISTPMEDYLDRRASLYLIRAMFDVIDADAIPGLLAGDASAAMDGGPPAAALADLDSDLMAEASYLLVSLRYLAEVGGAIWPDDKPASTYMNDTLALLDDLQLGLADAIAARSDPLPILERADEIYWWTEGYRAAPDVGHFASRDELVEQVLAAVPAQARL